MRKTSGAAYAALLVLVFVTGAVVVVENRTASVAANLGYEGPTAWLQVVDLGASARTRSEVVDFVDRRGLALAYTPSLDSGLLTLHDPRGLFRSADGALAEPLGGAGEPPAALVADVLGPAGDDLRGVLARGTRVVGPIDPAVSLDATAPVVIRNPAAGPLGGGLYVLAGADAADAQQLVDVLTAAGAWVGDAHAYGPVAALPYEGVRAAVLGGLLCLFVVMAVLVILLDVARDRDSCVEVYLPKAEAAIVQGACVRQDSMGPRQNSWVPGGWCRMATRRKPGKVPGKERTEKRNPYFCLHENTGSSSLFRPLSGSSPFFGTPRLVSDREPPTDSA